MSYATVIARLTGAPGNHKDPHTGQEVIRVEARIEGGRDTVAIVVAAPATSSAAKALVEKKEGELLLASGDLLLTQGGPVGEDGEPSRKDVPMVQARVICNGHEDQYLNEVILVGNIAGQSRASESAKSSRRSLALNRRHRLPCSEEFEEITDWYLIRGYGFTRDKLDAAPTGSLVCVVGCLEERRNKEGEPYCEIKARLVRVCRRGGSQGNNPAAGTSTRGYSHGEFTGDGVPDLATDWA